MSKSFRLPPDVAEQIENAARRLGVSQADVVAASVKMAISAITVKEKRKR